MYYTNCVNILAAFLTPTVATIAAYIAYKQHKIEEERLKISLFEKRYVIYNATREFIGFVYNLKSETCPENEKALEKAKDKLVCNLTSASFLFDDHIVKYIESLLDKAYTLNFGYIILQEVGMTTIDVEKLREFFLIELINMDKKFKKYMKIYYSSEVSIWSKIEEANKKIKEAA